jgi:hypothetical protein
VLISRLSGMQPGYMYGIIGAFVFATALGVADEGRMEARGAVALLVLALAAWFLRVPFEPTPGVPASGAQLTINFALVGIFVVAVEGLVFGLVPLRFLPGQRIWAWSRWRWALLWGAGLALFAHVLVYPVTVAQPNPDPASLTTTLVSVGIYGGVAVAFWLFFRWRGQQGAEAVEPAVESASAAEVPAAAESPSAAEQAADVGAVAKGPKSKAAAEGPAEGPAEAPSVDDGVPAVDDAAEAEAGEGPAPVAGT